NLGERDPDTHALFEKDEYFSVSSKIVPETYESNLRPRMTVSTSTHVKILKVSDLNKCPLKVSLAGMVEKASDEFGDNENAVIEVLVTDYMRRDYNFIIKVVFPHLSPQFKSLMSIVRPGESIVFVVGQMEFIDRELYMYAHDINCIDTHFIKKREIEIDSEQSMKSTRSRLLTIHKSISKRVKVEVNETKKDVIAEEDIDASNVDDKELIEDIDDLVKIYQDQDEEETNKSKKNQGRGHKKGKERAIQKITHNTRQSTRSSVVIDDNEEE
ncbi:6425_t:CDS:2, partial [Cetraspora pellucida]